MLSYGFLRMNSRLCLQNARGTISSERHTSSPPTEEKRSRKNGANSGKKARVALADDPGCSFYTW